MAQRRKGKISEYGQRLRAKQLAKTEYGIRERQFVRYFALAKKVRAATGAKLLELLERRLDNVVYRLDLAQTRSQARQLVSHGHVLVNGRKVTIPSYSLAVGDEISLKKPELAQTRGVDLPPWLTRGKKGQASGSVIALPSGEAIASEIDVQMIIEYYSR